MTALTKFALWRLVAMIGLLLLAILAGGQGLTLAWLSAFPANASRLDSLSIQSWSYLILSAVLFVFDVRLLVRTIRQANQT